MTKKVCAAIRCKNYNTVVCGVKHFDPLMMKMLAFIYNVTYYDQLPNNYMQDWETGFVDSNGEFYLEDIKNEQTK